MEILEVIIALGLLVFVAYRGFSVILFAPLIALGAVFFFQPSAVFPSYVGLFMVKASEFVKNYFPLFLLGAVFGKLIEVSGFSKSLVAAFFKVFGPKHSVLALLAVTSILSYGGISVFVCVFAVYPFAAEIFRRADIPKRLIPGLIWLGSGTYTMDAFPGSPQIQNIIPTTFFGTTSYAAPTLGIIGGLIVLLGGYGYFAWSRKKAEANGEGYDSFGQKLYNEPEPYSGQKLPPVAFALAPLIIVCFANYYFTKQVPIMWGQEYILDLPGMKTPVTLYPGKSASLWAVQIALFLGALTTFILGIKQIIPQFVESTKTAVSGSLLAIMNTSSEYGYGSIIAALPGFALLAVHLQSIPNPLINVWVTVTALAGIVGSASGGLSIALASMSEIYIEGAKVAAIPLDVVHRVASMASGGMDSLPHNGAVITLLAVTGLTHKQAYGPIFFLTVLKTLAAGAVILVYYMTGLV